MGLNYNVSPPSPSYIVLTHPNRFKSTPTPHPITGCDVITLPPSFLPKRKRLFIGTVPAYKNYAIGTVPAYKSYAIGTVPAYKNYAIGTVPADKNYAIGTPKN